MSIVQLVKQVSTNKSTMADVAQAMTNILDVELQPMTKFTLWVFLLRTTVQGRKVVKFLMDNVDKYTKTYDNAYIRRNRCVVRKCGEILNIPVTTHAAFLIMFQKSLYSPEFVQVTNIIRNDFATFNQHFKFLEKVRE